MNPGKLLSCSAGLGRGFPFLRAVSHFGNARALQEGSAKGPTLELTLPGWHRASWLCDCNKTSHNQCRKKKTNSFVFLSLHGVGLIFFFPLLWDFHSEGFVAALCGPGHAGLKEWAEGWLGVSLSPLAVPGWPF